MMFVDCLLFSLLLFLWNFLLGGFGFGVVVGVGLCCLLGLMLLLFRIWFFVGVVVVGVGDVVVDVVGDFGGVWLDLDVLGLWMMFLEGCLMLRRLKDGLLVLNLVIFFGLRLN